MSAPEQNERLALIAQAIISLRRARDALALAEAPHALEKVRHALKSAEGAYRNAGGTPSALSYGRVLASALDLDGEKAP